MIISTPALTFLWHNINNSQHQQMKPKEWSHAESKRTTRRKGPIQMIDTTLWLVLCAIYIYWTTTHVAIGYRRFWQHTHTRTHIVTHARTHAHIHIFLFRLDGFTSFSLQKQNRNVLRIIYYMCSHKRFFFHHSHCILISFLLSFWAILAKQTQAQHIWTNEPVDHFKYFGFHFLIHFVLDLGDAVYTYTYSYLRWSEPKALMLFIQLNAQFPLTTLPSPQSLFSLFP